MGHRYRFGAPLGTILIGSLLICGFLALPVRGAGELEISFLRNFGIGFGDYIQGQFTLTGTGGEEIVELHLYFNDLEVANATDNALKFKFTTDDYPTGATNISLVGFDATKTRYETSVVKTFINPVYNYIIIVGVVVLVVVSLYFKYGRKRKNSGS